MDLQQLDYQAMTFWWNITLTFGMAAIGLYSWLNSRDKVTRNIIDDVKSDIDTMEHRVTITEQKIASLPNEVAIGRLHERMDSLNREMGELSGQLESTNRLLNTLHNDRLTK